MDELYRGYRIVIKQAEGWIARITHVRGNRVPLNVRATEHEGPDVCLRRSRETIDRYIAFLAQDGVDGENR